jgi:hypothetical protein
MTAQCVVPYCDDLRSEQLRDELTSGSSVAGVTMSAKPAVMLGNLRLFETSKISKSFFYMELLGQHSQKNYRFTRT